MTTPAADLQQAQMLLTSGLPGAARMAAWVARTALESAVVDRLVELDHAPGDATMRSRLTCLDVVDPDRALVAEFAWNRLSNACHQHAFQLSPTVGEVRALIESVRTVSQAASPA